MSKDSVLRASELKKSYVDAGIHVDVLKGLSLDVKAGECVAIMGSSGSGKSTMLHCLGGLDKPDSGTIEIGGQDALELNDNQRAKLRNHYLGYVYQFHHLLPEFDALENVMMPLLIRKTAGHSAREKAKQLLEMVGLAKRINHRVGELSGGERQRVAIARALVGEPKCVLADEPTGNLDQATAEHITQLLLSLNRDLGTAFIIVTHNLELAERMHKKYFLADGVLHS